MAPAKTRTTKKPRSRTRLDVDERRSQLVALALDLFGERSYEEVAIDDIAAAAGMSKGLLYHYFPTKKDFYVAGLQEASRMLLEATLLPVDTGAPIDRVRAGLDAYLDYVAAHAPAYVALFRGGIGADRDIAHILESTREEIAKRILADVPTPHPTPLLRAAIRGWVGMVEAASLDWIAAGDVAREPLRDFLADMLLAAATNATSPREVDGFRRDQARSPGSRAQATSVAEHASRRDRAGIGEKRDLPKKASSSRGRPSR